MKKILFLVVFALALLPNVQSSTVTNQLKTAFKNVHITKSDSYLMKILSSVDEKKAINSSRLKTKKATINNIIDSLYNFQFDTNAYKWKKSSKSINFYEAYNISRTANYSWNGTSWIYDNLTDFTYNKNDNLTSSIVYNFNGTNWIPYLKDTTVYDSVNNIVQTVYYDNVGDAWKNSTLYDFTYNTSNDLTSVTFYEGVNDLWLKSTKDTILYDANKNIVQHIQFEWNGSKWVYTLGKDFTINFKNLNIRTLGYYWDGLKWINSYKDSLIYDSRNNMEREINYKWNATSKLWNDSAASELTYDANDLLIEYSRFDFDGVKPTNTYQQFYQYTPSNALLSSFSFQWNTDGTALVSADSIYNYYHNVSSSIENLTFNNSTISIFPNPTTSHIQVSGIEGKANVSLFGIDGKLLLSKEFIGKESISVSILPKGIYMVKVTTKEGVLEKKLVKK